jgi:ankyrin repeat protein
MTSVSNIDEVLVEEDEDGNTPLQACSEGSLDLVRRFLSAGTDPYEPPKGWYGETALQAASVK